MKEIHVCRLFFISHVHSHLIILFYFRISDLREHAIFTLRILLQGNRENQQFVDSLKPSQEWDEDGTLKTIVGATLK